MATPPMSSSQMPVYKMLLFSWFTKRGRIFRIILDVLAIIFFIFLMDWCGKIPFKSVELNVESFGPRNTQMEVVAILGNDTELRDAYDSTYRNSFLSSGRVGVQLGVIGLNARADGANDPLILTQKEQIHNHLKDNQAIDSLNAYMALEFKMLYKNDRIGVNVDEDKDHWKWTEEASMGSRYFEGTRATTKFDNFQRFLGIPVLHNTSMEGSVRLAYKDSIRAYAPYYLSSESGRGRKGRASKDALLQLCDVSQAYVGVKLNTKKTVVNGSDASVFSSYGRMLTYNESVLILDLEFGSPISCSNMYPEPDYVTMSSIQFRDPEKLRFIEDNGLVFLVKFVSNENLQTAKMFWITTGIALFISLLVDKLIQFFVYYLQRREGRKSWKKKHEQLAKESEQND